jgi:hypothetical protein
MQKDRRDVAAHERIAGLVALRNADFCGAPELPADAARERSPSWTGTGVINHP